MRTISELLRWRARRHPNLPMTWFAGRSRTYAEMDASTSALAGGLVRRYGLRAGDRVAILDKTSDAYLELLFALDKAGAVAVPVNWRLTANEIAAIAGDAEPSLMVVGDDFAIAADRAGCPVVGFDELPRTGEDPHRDAEHAVTWQLYTSGTTGLPKGAMLSNRNLMSAMFAWACETPQLQEGARVLVGLPQYHIGGCGWALMVMMKGATAVILREFDPVEAIRVLVQQRISMFLAVPAMLLFLGQVPEVERADLSTLADVFYGASPISQELLLRSVELFKCRFSQTYGLTESTGGITVLRHEDHRGERLHSCGRAMFGAEIAVVDPLGNPVPADEIGEVVYRGAGVMEGYWRRPEDTAEAIRDGWLRTGDAGSLDANGFLYIRDRVKDMIVSGGENVYPADVEGVLAGHPGLADVAVIGVPDELWGEAVKAVVVRRPGSALSQDELLAWCRGRLAGYKRPRSVDFVDALPRNPSGKLLKRELRAPYWAEQARQVN